MRAGAIVLLVAANAVIAVVIVAAALMVIPPDPESVSPSVTDTRGTLEIAELKEDLTALEQKLEVLETTAEMRGRENADLRQEIESLASR